MSDAPDAPDAGPAGAQDAEATRQQLLAGWAVSGDADLDASLRPRRLADFVGQPRVSEQLRLVLEGARARATPPDHLLFAGPPGLGKTSLAAIVAAELGVDLRATSGPALERPGDLAAILTNLESGDVLFVDEIHRLPRAVEEVLYPAMEDFHIDIVVGKGPGARSLRLSLPGFTLIGATTRTGLIAGPLRDRFGFTGRLELYEPDQLEAILARSAQLLGVEAAADGLAAIAGRSRGTPRIANRLLRRVRDYAEVRADGRVTAAVADDALSLFEVDHRGLDRLDRRVLTALCDSFAGGPVGLATLAVGVGEEPDTLAETVEPFLIQQGLLARTPRGRTATVASFGHLGLAVPPGRGEAAVQPKLDT
ncbi:MAG: Holliday junction branch migration DNA helicase RuvB [Actinobacteria bacterium QS_8_72_14]|nr:MAG: Holliday junction branch migration DNA helicase RuvB [Actinobacteria bacterium QS_8_72_14]